MTSARCPESRENSQNTKRKRVPENVRCLKRDLDRRLISGAGRGRGRQWKSWGGLEWDKTKRWRGEIRKRLGFWRGVSDPSSFPPLFKVQAKERFCSRMFPSFARQQLIWCDSDRTKLLTVCSMRETDTAYGGSCFGHGQKLSEHLSFF
jgi:hypothetical protein